MSNPPTFLSVTHRAVGETSHGPSDALHSYHCALCRTLRTHCGDTTYRTVNCFTLLLPLSQDIHVDVDVHAPNDGPSAHLRHGIVPLYIDTLIKVVHQCWKLYM